jgi:P4 family phage/plasmid primase-like protien
MSTELTHFLGQHRALKGTPVSHTGMGGAQKGSYFIPSEDKPRLLELLHKAIFLHGEKVSLVERPPAKSVDTNTCETLVKVDLDFRYPVTAEGRAVIRRHSHQHINDIIAVYHNAFRKYLKPEQLTQKALKTMVFERPAPYADKHMTKDGVHLMWPHLVTDTANQHLIREYAIEHTAPILSTLGCTNPVNDVIDKSIIESNGWLMYGCTKPNTKPYTLTRIVDISEVSETPELIDSDPSEYTTDHLLNLLSIRDFSDGQDFIKAEIRDEFKHLTTGGGASTSSSGSGSVGNPSLGLGHGPPKSIKITRQTQASKLNFLQSGHNIEEIRHLTRLLSKERADDYKTWLEVGLCLHNLDSHQLLDEWIRFSQLSPKFVAGRCELDWIDMKLRANGLGMGSLHRWAQQDDERGYLRVTRDFIKNDILRSQSGTTYDVALVIYNMYKYNYKCTSIKHDGWYEFTQHHWTPVERAVTLMRKIANEVVNEYLKQIEYFNLMTNNVSSQEQEKYIIRSKQLQDVTYKLRDSTFKSKLYTELRILFYDSRFESRLDDNPYLVGFDNGVYDLKADEFRDGRPEDMITISTGNDYYTFDDDDETLIEIFDFLTQVFPKESVRNYALVLLSSFLPGENPEEKIHIWSGVGGNGKSKLMELFEHAFGKYTAKVNISVFTQKIKANSSAPNPEVARLKGIRLASTQEPEENEKFNVGLMKEWSGGDRITCRGLHQDPFDFKPQFKIVCSCNHKPALPPDDDGTWRRISNMEFESRFVDNPDPNNPYEFPRDNKLSHKLYIWRHAFMYLLIRTCVDTYLKEGLKEPQAVKDSTMEYQRANDAIKDFIQCNLVKDSTCDLKLGLDKLYERMKSWWSTNMGTKAPNRRDFKSTMEKKIGKYSVSSGGGWSGWRLTCLDGSDAPPNEIVVAKGII